MPQNIFEANNERLISSVFSLLNAFSFLNPHIKIPGFLCTPIERKKKKNGIFPKGLSESGTVADNNPMRVKRVVYQTVCHRSVEISTLFIYLYTHLGVLSFPSVLHIIYRLYLYTECDSTSLFQKIFLFVSTHRNHNLNLIT